MTLRALLDDVIENRAWMGEEQIITYWARFVSKFRLLAGIQKWKLKIHITDKFPLKFVVLLDFPMPLQEGI